MKGEMENIEIKKGKIKYISFGLIMAMNFFRFSILSIIVASFPSIQQEFTLTNVELSFISTAFYLFSFVFTYLWIYLSGKYSNRLVFTIGTAFWVLPLFYFPYIQSYTVLILIVYDGIGRNQLCSFDKLLYFFEFQGQLPVNILSSSCARMQGGILELFSNPNPKLL